MIYARAYATTLVVFLALDYLWLGIIARGFYVSQLGSLMRDPVDYFTSGIFYLGYVAGIVYFAIAPAIAAGRWRKAALNGALLGLFAYGTYDMTNLATLEGWPLSMSLVDMAWGVTVTCVCALAGFGITRARI